MVRVSSSSSIHERPDHVQNMTNEVFEPCQTVWTRRWRNTLHRSRDAGNRLDKSYKIYRGRGRTTNKRTRATAGGTRTWRKRKNLSPGKTGHGTLGLLNSCVATTFLRSWTGRRWIVPEKNNASQPQSRDGTRLRRSTLVSKRSNVTVETHKRKWLRCQALKEKGTVVISINYGNALNVGKFIFPFTSWYPFFRRFERTEATWYSKLSCDSFNYGNGHTIDKSIQTLVTDNLYEYITYVALNFWKFD